MESIEEIELELTRIITALRVAKYSKIMCKKYQQEEIHDPNRSFDDLLSIYKNRLIMRMAILNEKITIIHNFKNKLI